MWAAKNMGIYLALAGFLILGTKPCLAKDSEATIIQALISESVGRYPGPCPCPYNTMKNGRKCGGNSAWSKPGGAAPLCYKDDINRTMGAQWRSENAQDKKSTMP